MWNYRIIKRTGKEDQDDYYGLFEMFYNDDNKISLMTVEPEMVGESVDELINSLKLMYNDAVRCKNDVLVEGEIEFAPICDDDFSEAMSFDEFIQSIEDDTTDG